jgi:molybdate transport system ATP-binding protein
VTGTSTIQSAFCGRLGGFTLDAVFEAPARGVTGLFGPSGCGKTTVLRCMAGLERFAGRLSVGGEIWQDDAIGDFRKPHLRPVGYVFQEASLFPHLSVRGNLLYGATRAAKAGVAPAIREADIVELLGIGDLLARSPRALSGGERQRVAVGRALLSQPRLLLMDEPLSALDRLSKEEILPYFEALHPALSIPIIYVSHDLGEVERLADHLVLMERGRVIAAGPLAALEADPALPLLRAPEAAVTLTGVVGHLDRDYRLTSVSVPGGTLILPGLHGKLNAHCRLRIRASDVSFALSQPSGTTILNSLPVRILSVVGEKDASQLVVVAALGTEGDGARIAGRITRKSRDRLGLAPGMAAFAQIKGAAPARPA